MEKKICVTIAGKPLEEIVSLVNTYNLAEIRTDLTELSIDDIRRLFALPHTQLAATCRQTAYNTYNKRIACLSAAIEAGASYVDIEADAPNDYRQSLSALAKQHGCKIIISHHDFEKTPDTPELENMVEKCQQLGADIIKLVTTAHTTHDCTRILALYAKYTNLIAFAMGDTGRITRLACLYLGAPFTYASINDDNTVAKGQISIADMEQLVHLLQKK